MAAVEVKGGGKYEAVLQRLVDLKMGVKAGVLKGATTTNGQSIAAYAAYNEYGTAHIPPRPFLRTTASDKISSWQNVLAHAVTGKVEDQQTWTRALTLTGEAMKANIKETIQRGGFAANAPGTIKAKQRSGKREPDHPLIDTGQMLAAISYEVVR